GWVRFLLLKAFCFLSLRSGGVLPGVHRVGLADQCRRFLLCRTKSSCTSSYPDRCAQGHRPLCLACMTAATGDSAPSNPRVRLAPASCSYGQESPGRKGSHALFSGSCQNKGVVYMLGCTRLRSSQGRQRCSDRCASAKGRWPVDGPVR